MMRVIAALVSAALVLGCGPYRIKYEYPSHAVAPDRTFEVVKGHAHGIGPLLIGGGGNSSCCSR